MQKGYEWCAKIQERKFNGAEKPAQRAAALMLVCCFGRAGAAAPP
jgi:hypothetical protein